MAESVNNLADTTLVCNYGETNNIFPIGGLVRPSKKSTTAAIRHCRHLVNFRIEQNDCLYIAKVLDGFIDHELVKMSIEICGIFDNFSFYHWDDFSDKSKCFDYGVFVYARETEDNLGVDASIVPTLMDNIPMRDYGDSNNIWT